MRSRAHFHFNGEAKKQIKKNKNKNASKQSGLPAELIKGGCYDLVEYMHQLIYRIFLKESIPTDWHLSVLSPVLNNWRPPQFSLTVEI